MKLAGLLGFITMMWIMILAVSAFLIIFVAPLDIIFLRNGIDRLLISIVQSSISIVVLIIFILGLSRMKSIYIQKKLRL
jgi:hypothetical protein